MKTVFLLSSFLLSMAFGQSSDYLNKSFEFIKNEFGLDKKSIGELSIKNQYRTDHNQVEHIHLVQTINGYEIFGTSVNLTFWPNGKISATGHRLTILDGIKASTNIPAITAPQAIGIASGELGAASRAVPSIVRTTHEGLTVYSKEDISLQDIPAQLGYLLTPSGEYRLSWRMQIDSRQKGNLYQSYVDAISGQSLANDVLTLRCSFDHDYLAHEAGCFEENTSPITAYAPPPVNATGQYRVLPMTIESPIHGGFELVTGIDDPVASPFGWHDVDGVAGNDFTITRGNNVHAFLDRDWNYSPDSDLDGGNDLIFDYPFNSTGEPSVNQNVALTNLFFWNNIMHDFSFRYGFNEAAGNFQALNYSGQGSYDDYVEAHAQFGDNNPPLCGTEANGDTPCLNNADFSTPIDGFNGRMRMFTWDRDNSSKHLDVLEPVELAGKILTGLAEFGADITTEPVTGFVVIANDGSSNPSHACNPLTDQADEIEGKIVLIDRGLCDFSEKVFNAQEAGAIGAIICNFEEIVIGMGAANQAENVTIPSVFISNGDCARIRVAAANNLKVSLVAPVSDGGPLRRDGSLDVSIVAHEYGHGISTRLTGGPGTGNCLSPSAANGEAEESWGMGEGWSDFFALALTARPGDTGSKKRGIGTYSNKESVDGRGIRSFPYSTDLSINPHTYDDILFESVPHGVGSVWTAMLWDLYWAFSDVYGWDPDVYSGTGGNNIALQLVMDGLKMQPCNPSFGDARDAILLADSINNGGANSCLIWEVFARRGLGYDAVVGDADSRSDGIQGFEPFPTCIAELKLTKNMTSEIIAGDVIEVTLHAVNHTGQALTNVFLEDPVPDGTTYLAGSANIEPSTGNTLVWAIDAMEPNEEITITYQLQSEPANNSVRMLYDDMEGDAFARWDVYYDEELTADNFWFLQDVIVNSGVSAWNVGDVATESKHYLQNYQPYDITGEYPVYRFFHYYNTEAGADGGFLEISTDGGDSWSPLEDKIFRNGYPRRLQYTTFAIPNLYAYSGLSHPEFVMSSSYIDLSDYVGESVIIRYTFGTDENTPGDGWYVDDVEIMDAVLYNSEACITSDQTTSVCAEAPQRGTIVDSQIMVGTDIETDNSVIMVQPNPAGDYIQAIISAVKSEDALVTVFDLTGQQLYSRGWSMSEGINQHFIDVSGLPAGMYIVNISSKALSATQKFIKE